VLERLEVLRYLNQLVEVSALEDLLLQQTRAAAEAEAVELLQATLLTALEDPADQDIAW
jgi:hypothetical protein